MDYCGGFIRGIFMNRLIRLFKTWTLWELFKGLSVTGRYYFKRKFTVQYPEEETPISPRFRGMLALRRYPNGEERCIVMVLDAQLNMKLICSNVSNVDSVKKLVL